MNKKYELRHSTILFVCFNKLTCCGHTLASSQYNRWVVGEESNSCNVLCQTWQVRALELEKELEMERTHLTELRKLHYHLAGAAEGWDDVSIGQSLP